MATQPTQSSCMLGSEPDSSARNGSPVPTPPGPAARTVSLPIACPCCGQPIGRNLHAIIDGLRDNTVRFVMLAVLAERFGEWVRRPQLINLMYGHRVDGGPASAERILHVYAHELRRTLRPYELTIEGMRTGLAAGAFRLKWAVPLNDGRDWLSVAP